MQFILFTQEQVDAVLAWGEETTLEIAPRLIDNPHHPEAGSYVAPERVVWGEYAEFWAEKLAEHRRLTAEPGALFLPSEI